MDLSDLKWVSKRNLQTFWDGIKGSLFGDLAFHEDNATSGHAYSAGDLLGHESHLYRATSNIAAGDTLESGVNIERTLVDAEIKRSRQSVNTEFDPRLSNILGDLATVEAEMVATQNYNKGDYIVIGDYFYKATDAITSGDTLTVGTNIERTNVGAEMNIGTKEYKNGGITSPFTATHRGFLYFSIKIVENSNVNISINGNDVINIGDHWTGNATEVVIPYTLYVDVGDVVAWTINGPAGLLYIRYVY